jgi:hypothetical protein
VLLFSNRKWTCVAGEDQSFGLHSPDQVPEDADFQSIASSFGLLSPDQLPPGIYEGVYDARMFSDRGLYVDPDIIGELTRISSVS